MQEEIEDVVIDTFTTLDAVDEMDVPVFVVYGTNTIEYPGKYVARLFDIDKPTPYVVISDTEEQLHEDIQKTDHTVVFFGRDRGDDPAVIGSWL